MARNTLYVTDAGANAIFAIDLATGQFDSYPLSARDSTVLTAADAAVLELPACTIGETYNAEPLPTDVEVGQDDYLHFSSLHGVPGGGEMAGSVLPPPDR